MHGHLIFAVCWPTARVCAAHHAIRANGRAADGDGAAAGQRVAVPREGRGDADRPLPKGRVICKALRRQERKGCAGASTHLSHHLVSVHDSYLATLHLPIQR